MYTVLHMKKNPRLAQTSVSNKTEIMLVSPKSNIICSLRYQIKIHYLFYTQTFITFLFWVFFFKPMMHNNIKSVVYSSNRKRFDCNEKQFIGSVFNRPSRDTVPTARVLIRGYYMATVALTGISAR